MSHAIYNAEGFILKSVNFNEANKYYYIFTREFGLIRASAQGVRHLQSKLRYGLSDFSLAKISLVRGRETWRLTGAEPVSDFKKINSGERENFLLVSRIFSLLLRLLHGEEKNEQLFDYLFHGFKFLQTENLDKKNLEDFECVLALRILSSLGYIGQMGDFDQFNESPYFTRELLSSMSILKSRAILEINKSLKETHL
ncbi:MAG: DNA repair protein RecO [Candidatus Paceibacterota bacterium]